MAFDFDGLDEHDVPGTADLTLYVKACAAGGGAKGLPEEYLALLREAAEAAIKDGIAGAPARQLLALICYSAAMSLSACTLLTDRDSVVFQSFLQFVLQATGAPALELRAVRGEQCTAEICPGVPRLQLSFMGNCIYCYMRSAERKAAEAAGGQAGVYVPFLCQGAGLAPGGPGLDAPEELLHAVREAAGAAKATSELPQISADWPVAWRRIVAHLVSMRALERFAEVSAPLGATDFASLQRLDCALPPVKVKTLRSIPTPGRSSAPPGLMLVLHGGLQTERHLKFMHMSTGLTDIAPPTGQGVEILGVEADFAYQALAAGLTKPAAGFSYLRFEGCFARLGEYVISAARVFQQCVDKHVHEHPGDGTVGVDLYGFSAGGMLAWLLLCMMPLAAERIRLRTLTLLSPRLEGMHDCWESAHLKAVFIAHGTRVFLGYGELEDLPEQGSPFSAVATSIAELLPSASCLRARAYHGVGHTMTTEEFMDVRAFLQEVWQRPG